VRREGEGARLRQWWRDSCGSRHDWWGRWSDGSKEESRRRGECADAHLLPCPVGEGKGRGRLGGRRGEVGAGGHGGEEGRLGTTEGRGRP
jgi:hypothetical protein